MNLGTCYSNLHHGQVFKFHLPLPFGAFPGGSDSKESTCNAGDPGSIPGLGRPPREGHGNPLWYSCLENSMDRGAWWATVHGVTKRHTLLSDWHLPLQLDSQIWASEVVVRNSILEFWKSHQGRSPVTLALIGIFPLTIKRNTPQDYEGWISHWTIKKLL